MKFSNRVYDALKWIALICIPALAVAIPQLCDIWGADFGEPIARTLEIIGVLIGALIGISTFNYNKEE